MSGYEELEQNRFCLSRVGLCKKNINTTSQPPHSLHLHQTRPSLALPQHLHTSLRRCRRRTLQQSNMRVSLQPSFSLNIVALVFPVKFAAAQSSTASFVYPNPGTSPASQLTINLFDFIHFEWTSNYEQAFLYIWYDDGKGDGIVDKCTLHLYEVTNSSPLLNDGCATNGMHSQGLYRDIDTNGRLEYSPSEQSDYYRN